MSEPSSSSSDNAELPPPPAAEPPALRERASSVKAAPPPVASHDEDLPLPLPPDWYEKKAAKAKAKTKTVAAAGSGGGAAGAASEDKVVRNRPSAEMLRAATAAASGDDRAKAYQANLKKGDEFAAEGRWQDAASAYEVAARKAPTPAETTAVGAKAAAARAAAGRPRRQLVLLAVIGGLSAAGAGGWWVATRPAAVLTPAQQQAASLPPPTHLLSDDKTPTSGNLSERAKANAVLFSLTSETKDGVRPWSEMLKAAKAAAALPGVNAEEAQQLVSRIDTELAVLDKDSAAIEAVRISDPAKALALATAFRTTRQRAGDYIARLPRPGRLQLVDCPPTCTATLDGAAIDAKAASNAGGMVFCRSAQRALTVVVSAPGYLESTLTIPPDSTLSEQRSQITMEEPPLWTMVAPAAAPAWAALENAAGTVLMATPQLVQAVSPADGSPPPATMQFHAGGAVTGLAERSWTWSALLAGDADGFLLSTSNGALCRVAKLAGGLHAELIARADHAPATFATAELVLRLNAKAVFTGAKPWEPKAAFGTPKEEVAKMLGQSEVHLTSEGKTLWSLELESNLPPDVFTRGEQLLAIDDHAIHVLDQEGKPLHSCLISGPRRAGVCALGHGGLLVVPGANAVVAYQDKGGGDYQSASIASGLRAVANDGDDLAAASAQELHLYQYAGGQLSERWKLTLGEGTAVEQLCLHGGVLSFYDPNRHLLHLFQAADHKELHRLRLIDGVLCAPLFLPDRVLVVDRRGSLRAFPLNRPIPLGAGAP